MIIFYSAGGLGNQMFQYAAGRRLAHVCGAELAVDTSWYRRRTRDTPRRFELFRLGVKLRELKGGEAFRARLISDPVLSRLPLPRRWVVHRERGFGFDEAMLRRPDESYLHGYWQSPKYFEDIRGLLLAELWPVDAPSDADLSVQESMQGCESVFFHVRRGDYVSLPSAAAWHGTCTLDYYRAAFEHLSRSVCDPVLYVFSDDPTWAREHIRFDAPTVYVDHNGPDRAHHDLRLMASCRHAVIANSSFSWWGAWLGQYDKKVVIAPSKWFAKRESSPDLIPASWRII